MAGIARVAPRAVRRDASPLECSGDFHLRLLAGLHSLDFAFWRDRRPLWDVGLIALSAGGLASSGIGLWMGLGRVRRAFGRMRARLRPTRRSLTA